MEREAKKKLDEAKKKKEAAEKAEKEAKEAAERAARTPPVRVVKRKKDGEHLSDDDDVVISSLPSGEKSSDDPKVRESAKQQKGRLGSLGRILGTQPEIYKEFRIALQDERILVTTEFLYKMYVNETDGKHPANWTAHFAEKNYTALLEGLRQYTKKADDKANNGVVKLFRDIIADYFERLKKPSLFDVAKIKVVEIAKAHAAKASQKQKKDFLDEVTDALMNISIDSESGPSAQKRRK
eukprot:2578533-Rhodomonas_salina.1